MPLCHWMNDVKKIILKRDWAHQFWARPRFWLHWHSLFSVPPLLGKRSSITLSCGASLWSSIRLWGSSNSRMRTGPSSGHGCWKSYGNAKTCTTGDSSAENCTSSREPGRGLACSGPWCEWVILIWTLSWSVLGHFFGSFQLNSVTTRTIITSELFLDTITKSPFTSPGTVVVCDIVFMYKVVHLSDLQYSW